MGFLEVIWFFLQVGFWIIVTLLAMFCTVKWLELTGDLYNHLIDPKISFDQKWPWIPVMIFMGAVSLLIVITLAVLFITGIITILGALRDQFTK